MEVALDAALVCEEMELRRCEDSMYGDETDDAGDQGASCCEGKEERSGDKASMAAV
jgi:hypothetical protein